MSFENWQKENKSVDFTTWQQQNTAMLLNEETIPLADTYSGLDIETAQKKADNIFKMSINYELPFSEVERLNAEADAINIHDFLNKPAPAKDDRLSDIYGARAGTRARDADEIIEYNYRRLPDNPRMKAIADRYISQRNARIMAKEANTVDMDDVLDFNAQLAYLIGGQESAEAIMKANLFRNKPKVSALFNDNITAFLRNNPEQSFVASILNTDLDLARAEEINDLANMERETRDEYYKSKGDISTSEFYEKKDKREYMLFSDVLKAMKNEELRGAVNRVQDPEGNYQKSDLTEHGFSVNFDRDMLLVRDHYFAMEEAQARSVNVFTLLSDMGLNMVRYMGEIAILSGLGGAKTGRITFRGLRQVGIPKILARNVAKLSAATKMALLNPANTANLTIERITDKGFIDDIGSFIKTDEGQSIVRALPKSFAEQTVTFFIEQKGEDLVKGLLKVGGGVISKLPRGLVSKLDEVADFMKKTGVRSFDKLPSRLKGNLASIKAFIKKGKPVLRAGKFSGLFGENLEEYADKIVKTGLLLDEQYRDKDEVFLKRLAKSFIPNPTEVLYQSILFTIMPFAAGAIANTPKAVNWVGQKLEGKERPGLPEIFNRARFEDGIRDEYGFDRQQAFEVANIFEANESIEAIEKKVRTFEEFGDFTFDEHNNQKALSAMLIDRGLIVEEANRIAELTARQAVKQDVPIENVIDTPQFRNQVETAEKVPVVEPEPKPAVVAPEKPAVVRPVEEIAVPEPVVKPEIEPKPLPAKEVTVEKVEVKPPEVVTEGKVVSEMTLGELKKESAIFDRKIETEKKRLDKIAPTRQVLGGAGIQHLSPEDAIRMAAVNSELGRREIISKDEVQERVTIKRQLREKGIKFDIKDTTENLKAKLAPPAELEVKVEAPPKQIKEVAEKINIAQANTSEEVDEAIPSLTAARQVDIAADREALGLNEIPSPERKSWQTSLQNAKDAGIPNKALRISTDVIAKPRALNDETTAGLVIAAAKLKTEYKDIITKINESTDEAEIDILSSEANNIESEFSVITEALHKSGTEKGRALAAQKLTIDRSFDLISVKSRARAIKGKPLSESENKRFEKLSEELGAQTEKVAELQKKLTEMEANQIIKRGRRIIVKRTQFKLNADIQSLGIKVRQLLEAGCN